MKYRVLMTLDIRVPKGKIKRAIQRALERDQNIDDVRIIDCDEARSPIVKAETEAKMDERAAGRNWSDPIDYTQHD